MFVLSLSWQLIDFVSKVEKKQGLAHTWRLRLVVVKMRALRRVEVIVADWHVCSRVVCDDRVAEWQEPRRILGVGHLLSDECVPRQSLDAVSVCHTHTGAAQHEVHALARG
eukprot:SAG11_NODE_6730_length_1258_cov_1.269198_2_plen_111_part_00